MKLTIEEEKIEIKGFTFYSNYFDFYKNLSDKERLKLADAILFYMFENKEPNNLNGMLTAIWTNIKMPLDNSKINIRNGKKGGRPKIETITEEKVNKNRNNNPKETETITEEKAKVKANNISNFYFLISNFFISNFLFLNNKNNKELLENKVNEWIKYKIERKDKYTETGFNILLKKIEKATEKYGVERVIELIDESMANNYQGIIFDKLEKMGSKNNDNVKVTREYTDEQGDQWQELSNGKRIYMGRKK